jgi:hypothetical protein
MRKLVVILLIASIIITNSFIVFSSGESRAYFYNNTINVTSAIALASSILTIYKLKLKGFYGKIYTCFSIGLALWFVAEIMWTYYQIGLRVEVPFPSLADAFWISGYVFFSYFIFQYYNLVKKTIEEHVLLLVLLGTAILVVYIVNLILTTSSLISIKQENIAALVISIIYPIVDGILLVPSILVFWSLQMAYKKQQHTEHQQHDTREKSRRQDLIVLPHVDLFQWILISLWMISVAIADTGFAYTTAFNIGGVKQEEWVWDMFYNASYLFIAAALFWYCIYGKDKPESVTRDKSSFLTE